MSGRRTRPSVTSIQQTVGRFDRVAQLVCRECPNWSRCIQQSTAAGTYSCGLSEDVVHAAAEGQHGQRSIPGDVEAVGILVDSGSRLAADRQNRELRLASTSTVDAAAMLR
jgi:hypothetical protein